MLGTIHLGKYFQVIEYIFFFVLCGVSVYFMYGVLDKFFSGKTSISQSEVSVKDLPTIVLCLDKASSRKTDYEYGSDFMIQYGIYDKTWDNFEELFLYEGRKSILFDETINLEKMTLDFGNCYKLTSTLTNECMLKHERERDYKNAN